MSTSFLRFVLGFLGIVALALALMFMLGVLDSHGRNAAKVPEAVGSVVAE